MCLKFRCGKMEDVMELRQIWKEAFEDTDAYLDTFYSVAFSPERCRLATVKEEIAAVLYWFPCSCCGQDLAYVYAVATKKAFQGKGLATALMENLNVHLEGFGVAGIILVPGSVDLVRFYEKRGYTPCAMQKTIGGTACGKTVSLQKVNPEKYEELRRKLLPHGGVAQEGVNLEFLARSAALYAGENLLLAAVRKEDGTILGLELLCQNPEIKIPGILNALNIGKGKFRIPSADGKPFALFHPLKGWEGDAPAYFAFAFE